MMLTEHHTMMVKAMVNMTNGHTQVKMSVLPGSPFDADLEHDIKWAMSDTASVAADQFVHEFGWKVSGRDEHDAQGALHNDGKG